MRPRARPRPFGAALLLLALGASCAEEPTFEGLKLSRWDKSLTSPLVQERIKACEAMGAMGTAAAASAPAVGKLLLDDKEDVRRAASGALAKMGAPGTAELEAKLPHHDLVTRLYAARGLLLQAPQHDKARQGVVAAFSALGNSGVAERGRQVVEELGPMLVPELGRLLDDPYAPLRVVTLETLGVLAPHAKELAPKVAEQLKHSAAPVRKAALRALARIAPKDVALPAIQGLVNDPDGDVANTAQEMIAYIAPELLPKEP